MKISQYTKILPNFFLLLLSGYGQSLRAQSATAWKSADSLFQKKQWSAAKSAYQQLLLADSSSNLAWNRLGYCNQHLGNYEDAIKNYHRAMENNPPVQLKNVAMYRLAMTYSLQNKPELCKDWLVKSTAGGYNPLHDLDSLPEFKNLRASADFTKIRQEVYESLFPCSKEPHYHDFDFWIGDWIVYQTGTQNLAGNSHIESISGGCAILENYTSTQAYTGKSFNFYDSASGKWEQDWIGAGGTSDHTHFYNGVYKDSKMQFTYETKGPNGEKIKGNFIFYYINRDSVRQYQDVTDETGKTVSVTYDLTYLRKK